jgi:hypothetical protein
MLLSLPRGLKTLTSNRFYPAVVGFLLGMISLYAIQYMLQPSVGSVSSSHVLSRPVIVAFGDSLTQRAFMTAAASEVSHMQITSTSDNVDRSHVGEGPGWLSLLSEYYARKVDVINRGFSGYNSKYGLGK